MSGKVNKFDCISIIIPVYNGALYITNLIYNLTFGQKFHNISLDILVIDDKSTDDTLEVLQALNFPNLRIIPLEQNYGTSHARNIGLDAAWGDYILFIDADDTISDAFFYNLQSYFDSSIDCYIFDMYYQYKSYSVLYNFIKISDKRDIVRLGSVCNKIFKKSLLPKFDVKNRFFEDTLLLFELLKTHSDITTKHIKEIYYMYNRTNITSKTNTFESGAYLNAKNQIFDLVKTADRLTKMVCLETYVGVLFVKHYPVWLRLRVATSALYTFYRYLPYVIIDPIRFNLKSEIILKSLKIEAKYQ